MNGPSRTEFSRATILAALLCACSGQGREVRAVVIGKRYTRPTTAIVNEPDASGRSHVRTVHRPEQFTLVYLVTYEHLDVPVVELRRVTEAAYDAATVVPGIEARK